MLQCRREQRVSGVEMSGMNLTLVNGFGWNFINANLNGSLNVIKMEIAVIQETPVFASPTDPVKSQDCG